MSRTRDRNRILIASLCIATGFPPFSAASPTHLTKLKAKANPPQYVAFSRLLSHTDRQHHALNRLTFGPRLGDIERLQEIGIDKWLQLELHPESVIENPDLERRIAPYESLRLSIHDTYRHYPPQRLIADGTNGANTDRRLFGLAPVDLRRQGMLSISPQKIVALDLTEGKLMRAIYSNRQLQELLADFWFNHFNVFLNKGADRYMIPTYEREAIRPYMFGRFYDMLVATAKSPAMLFFLDNWQSVGVDSAFELRHPNQKKRGLNENYGRELLELHTLGVDGGYTQKDVVAVARCFTGWTIANPRKGGDFEYNDEIHDKTEKVVLGHVIAAGGGMNDGLKVLDILAHHPSTAHFISLKLAQRFVADDPPPSLVARMAAVFLKSDGNLREVMYTLLNSPEFWSEGAYRAKVKMPFEMVVSAVRATGADVSSPFLLSNELQKLGEPLYRKIEPTGYSSLNAEWVSSAGLLDRMNFALALTSNRVSGIKVDTAGWQQTAERDPMLLAELILEQAPSPQTKGAIEEALQDPELQRQSTQNVKAGPSLVAGLTLGSPEFQRH